MGALHAQKLAQLAREGSVRLIGVHDIDPARAREVAAPLDCPVLERLDDVAKQAEAACVAVPTAKHAEVAATLLGAGLDVLVEKPIATTREGARELIETAKRADRILQVGHIERFSQALRAVAPVLDRPRFIEAHRIGPYPGRATDVSVVLDLMIHDLDIAAELAGSEAERVEAIGVPVLSETEDIANARIRFANGCILNITASRVSLEPLRKIGEPPKITSQVLEFDRGDALLAQDRAFVEAVRGRGSPAVGGEEGLRALDLALRVQESIPPLEELGA
jgi:predicted dehydrogenase